MRTVLLLGAGATLAHAQALGTKSKYLPPLDTNLFERARILGVDWFDDVRVFVKTHFGFSIGETRVSAEHVFNLVHQLAVDEPYDVSEAAFILYKLRRLYLGVIAECTNRLDGKVTGGLYGLLKRLLEEVGRERLSIVTFNYDLIVEKSLAAFSKTANSPNQLFSIQASYQVKFDNYFPGGGSEEFWTPMFPEVIQVIKPHGSMNWFLAYEDADDFRQVNPSEPAEVWCCQDTEIRKDYRYHDADSDLDSPTFFLKPLIVPPVFDKAKYWATILGPQWVGFERALSEADRLVVCGYSLPDADVKAQCVIASALAQNQHLRRLDVVDVNPAVCNRVVQKTCVHALNYFDSINSFLDQKP